MLAFYEFHPLNKYASNGINTPLAMFNGMIRRSKMKKGLKPVKPVKPNFIQNMWDKYKPEIISGIAGIPFGIYFGNEIYKNSMPRVNEY